MFTVKIQQQIDEAIRSHFLRIGEELARGGMNEPEPMETNDNNNEGEEPIPSWMAESHLYNVGTAFLSEDRYWVNRVRGERFSDTLKTGILYRPQITDELTEMVDTVLQELVAKGIMLKGPHGVGKSHSLVSLVRKLVYGSGNRYLVTFIPDCDQWESLVDLLDAVCGSFGLSFADLNLSVEGNEETKYILLQRLVSCIDGILESMSKQWVFVFDQINRIFSRLELQREKPFKDVGVLPFPFNRIKHVMKPGRITSIISASANNQVAYKEHHEGFVEFEHTTQLTEKEIIALYDLKDKQDSTVQSQIKGIDEHTGRVPLYIRKYLDYTASHDQFDVDLETDVTHSLVSLKEETSQEKWELIQEATIASLLAVPLRFSLYYDRKFFTVRQTSRGYIYEPLLPQVRTASRTYFWEKLMDEISEKEAVLLNVCAARSTKNSARGDHFEYMAIQRCLRHGVVATIGNVSINLGRETAQGFSGGQLPQMERAKDGIYFPYNSQFPAVDLVLKKDSSVFGVQIHVSRHADVITMFEGMCMAAGWFEEFENVYLVYLSPEEQVEELVRNLVVPDIHNIQYTRSLGGRDLRTSIIRRIALPKEAVECLADLQWPAGCSIGSQ